MDAQNQTPAAQETEPFFFELIVQGDGASTIRYQRNAPMIFGSLIAACRNINDNFDNPLPSVGDFIRYLADAADEMDAKNAEQQTAPQENSQPASA